MVSFCENGTSSAAVYTYTVLLVVLPGVATVGITPQLFVVTPLFAFVILQLLLTLINPT